MIEDGGGQNPPLEFKVLERRPSGLVSFGWYHGQHSLGSDQELERILNTFGAEGWDVVQQVVLGGTGAPNKLILRRRAR